MKRPNPLLFLLLLITVFFTGCFESKTVVTRVQSHVPGTPRPKLNGVFFSLPRTVVKVDLPIVRTSRRAAQFSKLSPFFFSGESFTKAIGEVINPTALEPNLANATKEEGRYYGFDDPKFSTRGEPDPNQTFMINIRGGKFETKTLMLEVTEDGIIAKAEAEAKNEAIDFFTQSLKTAVSIAAPVIPFNLAASENRKIALAACGNALCTFEESLSPTEEIIYSSLPQAYRDFLAQRIGLMYLAALGEHERFFFWTLTAKQMQYYTANFGPATAAGYPDPASDLPRAKLAYNQIQKLIEERAKLVSSPPEPGSPAETLAAKLKEIDTSIKSYKQAYFLGAVDQETWIGNFEFAPPAAAPYVLGLLSYSERNGICAITGGKGPKGIQPPGKFMDGSGACPAGRTVLVEVASAAGQFAAKVRAGNFNEAGERGFYYRVPATASALLCERPLADGVGNCTGADAIGRDELSVAQLGEIVSLPASTGGRRSSYKIVYYSSTGAIQTFNIASDSLIQKSNLADIDSAATGLRDAKTEKLKRDTERLKAEKDYLEAKEALKKAREENSNSNTNGNPNP